jgi:hypothetical protein
MYLLRRARAPLVPLIHASPAIFNGMTRSTQGEIKTAACGGTKPRAGSEVNGWTRSAQGSTMEVGNRVWQRDLVGAGQD